jgi:arginase
MGRGPERLLADGLADRLAERGHSVGVETIESEDPFPLEVGTSFRLCRQLAQRVRANPAALPVVLAGNCGSTMGALAGLYAPESAPEGPGLGLIWFDCHGDFHTPLTTESGFLDGMGLATINGLGWPALTATIPGFRALPGPYILHAGGRDLDEAEPILLESAGVYVASAGQFLQAGAAAALAPALDAWQAHVQRVYVHLDLDVLDPAEARANQYAPPGGLPVELLAQALAQVRGRFPIAGVSLTAYDPDYDPDGRMAGVAARLLSALL